MRRLAVLLLVLAPALADAQYGASVYYPRGPYYGFWTGPAFGYFPGAYGGFWTNGYSLYGPPVPTYGSIPGFFGGADQRLNNGVNPYYAGFAPYGYYGVSIPLNRPRPVWVPGPALCEIHLPHPDAELLINGTAVSGAGSIRQITAPLPAYVGTTWEIEVRWSSPESIGSARRNAVLRGGEKTVVDFTDGAGPATLPPPRRLPVETIPVPARPLP